jgi:hypothetical protein
MRPSAVRLLLCLRKTISFSHGPITEKGWEIGKSFSHRYGEFPEGLDSW